MNVYVLMGNDFPSQVYADAQAAEAEVKRLNDADVVSSRREGRGRIYWRVYEFQIVASKSVQPPSRDQLAVALYEPLVGMLRACLPYLDHEDKELADAARSLLQRCQ